MVIILEMKVFSLICIQGAFSSLLSSILVRLKSIEDTLIQSRLVDGVDFMDEGQVESILNDDYDGEYAIAEMCSVATAREMNREDKCRLFLSAVFRQSVKLAVYLSMPQMAFLAVTNHQGDIVQSGLVAIKAYAVVAFIFYAVGGVDGLGRIFDQIESRLQLSRVITF